jgi:hypothetical protein
LKKTKSVKKTRSKSTKARSLVNAIRENNELLREAIEKLDDKNHNSNIKTHNFHPMLQKQQNPLDNLKEDL